MNAKTPELSPVALTLAGGNTTILAALLDGPAGGKAELAKRAAVDSKNIGRTIANLEREGLVSVSNEPKRRGTEVRNAGEIEITDAGRHAHRVAEFAAGKLTVGSATEAAPAAGLLLLHHQMKPNPAQPRQRLRLVPLPPEERAKLDSLKASVKADLEAGREGVIKSLSVFPADPDGVHAISDGERRWIVVGEGIAEGWWPSDKPLLATVRENSPGQAAFVALVANGQHDDLSVMEKARALSDYCAETGLSARAAGLQTGIDGRTAAEMLKVLKEGDPDDIAAFEAGRDGWTWERLRESVRDHREPEPQQADIEEIAGPGSAREPEPGTPAWWKLHGSDPAPKAAAQALPEAGLVIGGNGGGTSQPPKPARQPVGPDHVLDQVARVTMAELAWKLRNAPDGHHAADDSPLANAPKYWLDDVFSELVHLLLVIPVPSQVGPRAAMLKAGWAWVDANFLVLDEATLEAERQKLPNPHAGGALGYVTPWLNAGAPAAPGAGPPPAGEAAEREDDQAGDLAPLEPWTPAEPEVLFALHVGDVVSIGGEASGYRLISADREGGLSGPSFLAQQVSLKTGKDIGKPRGVTLHAIQRLVRRAEA